MTLELRYRSNPTIDPISGTHLRPRRAAPGRVLLVESDDDRARAWRAALAPSQVVRVEALSDARSLFFFPREAPDLMVIGCGIRAADVDRDSLVDFFCETGVARSHAIYVDARRCSLEVAIAMLTIGAAVRPGLPWQGTSGDWARSVYANGSLCADEDIVYELAKTVASTEVADRHNLTGAHLELLRALLEEDHRREVAKLIGRSHGTVRVQLSQMRDRSHVSTGELVRETYGAAAKCMPHLARLMRR